MGVLMCEGWGEVERQEPKIPSFMEIKPLSIEEYNEMERQRKKVVMRRRKKAIITKQRKRRFTKIALIICAISLVIGFVLGLVV